MSYQQKNYDYLLGIEGLSDELLNAHFTLYQGYVKNVNSFLGATQKMIEEDDIIPIYFSELKRRLGWEWNGMRLHELYFGNMAKGGNELAKNSELYKKIIKDFGSYENWEKEFKAIGVMRGIGWVILYYDKEADKLMNVWIGEHDSGHLAGCVPLLVTDVFEHAYMLDYGIARADYVEIFKNIIDWSVVAERYSD
ncbi:superoxide dismutase [bacterium (Candidatus Howlettbacteria) CG_4_10_14_0_8_um_filter_40_9]|nr:MAG: superoxide dismutase [bacterium (Candidatus Howlettbacteria) CG_4_10_14_0_8_um_filter_40_9]